MQGAGGYRSAAEVVEDGEFGLEKAIKKPLIKCDGCWLKIKGSGSLGRHQRKCEGGEE